MACSASWFLPSEMTFKIGMQGHVFTVGVDSRWREYTAESVDADCFGYPVLFNGVLHWRGYDIAHPGANIIYAFDLEEEKGKVIQLPLPLQIVVLDIFPFVGILNDHLCAVGEEDCSCIWRMKDYGVVESWTKYIVVKDPIPHHSFLLYPGFVCIVASHAFAKEEEDMDSRMFACYGEIKYMPYVPCFSSLKDVLKGGNLAVRKI